MYIYTVNMTWQQRDIVWRYMYDLSAYQPACFHFSVERSPSIELGTSSTYFMDMDIPPCKESLGQDCFFHLLHGNGFSASSSEKLSSLFGASSHSLFVKKELQVLWISRDLS